MDQKKTIRKSMCAKRQALSQDTQALHAKGLLEQFKKQLPVNPKVACYLPNNGEIDPMPLCTYLKNLGSQIFLPILINDHLTFAPFSSQDDLVDNCYNIPEPIRSHPKLSAIELDMILLPCVAIDKTGNRIGRGGGFYDKSLHDIQPNKTILVACAHEFQVLPNCPYERWDIKMDWVLTNKHSYRCKEFL